MADKPPPFVPRGVGEIVLRVRDMQAMVAFYRAAFGLQVLRRFDDDITFLKVAEGLEGHTQIIGLFRDRMPSSFRQTPWPGHDSSVTSLHHFALELPLAEYDAAAEHLESLGLEIDRVIHAWCGWRSIYVRDPEGNTVELVSYDRSVLE